MAPIAPYSAPFLLPCGHLQTVYPSLFRKQLEFDTATERLETDDGDFIDVHWAGSGRRRDPSLVIVSHGLEGHGHRKYVRGMMRAFMDQGWDSVSYTQRGCGPEINRNPGMYHSGFTDDLHSIVSLAVDRGYAAIALVGFSMGGNQTLKYLGENPDRVPPQVRAAVAVSVPCDLEGSAEMLGRRRNRVFMRYFLRTLRKKVRAKNRQYPELYSLDGLDRIRTFEEFDGRYTAPVFGFDSATDYWRRCSSLRFLSGIRVPSLILNAANDPFLSPSCYPVEQAGKSTSLTLEIPKAGGHVGFPVLGNGNRYWSEMRAAAFVSASA